MAEPATEPQQATILFLDDEPSILSALRRLFRPEGYRVLLADSGAAALKLLEGEDVDLVVSDMRMPEMDGAQFLQEVRQRWPRIVRILLTGYADIGSTIAAINGGEIHRYVAKPWDDQDILLIVREGLQRRRLEDENRRLLQLTREQNDQLLAANLQLEQRVKARTQEIAQVNDMLQAAYAQLEHNFLLSIDVFAGLMELRDGGSAGHSRRVAIMARRISEKMALGAPAAQDVFVAGLLHEIGKIGFPDDLLKKPVSAMTGEDMARYKRHPLNAEAALLPLAQLQRVAKIVRWHNERIDGQGFPDGLAGEELPLTAQIVGLASHYHGLIAGRLAERRHSEASAAALVIGGRGQRHEASVIAAFEAVLAETPVAPAQDRQVLATELQPGMVLSRDLLGPQGTLLLAAGFEFDARVVRQIHEFAQREQLKLTLHVRQ